MDSFHQLVSLRIANVLTSSYGYMISYVSTTSGNLFLLQSKQQYPYLLVMVKLSGASEPLTQEETFLLEQSSKATHFLKSENQEFTSLILSFDREFQSSQADVSYIESNQFDAKLLAIYPELSSISFESDNPQAELTQLINHQNELTLARKKQLERKALFHFAPVSLGFIGVSVVMFVLVSLLQFKTEYPNTALILAGGLYAPFVQGAFEYWRFLTSGFIHGGLLHLFVNCISFYNLGMILEKIYSPKKLIGAILFSIILGNSLAYLAAEELVVGLSGGIYGLFGLLIVYYFETGLNRNKRVLAQLYSFFFINLAINLLPNVSYMGHLGGFIGGILGGILISESSKLKSLIVHTKIAMAGLAILLGVLFVHKPLPKQVYLLTDTDTIMTLRQFKLDFYADYLQNQMVQFYTQVTNNQ